MLRTIKNKLRFLLGVKSETDYYSQGGEDAIVSKTFNFFIPVNKGFYLDIGAFHPYKHSNTYILYKAGWNGINIDPRPGSKQIFDRHRNRDINIEAGIGSRDGQMTYYFLGEDSTMNSFSKSNLERLGIFDQVKKTIDIPVFTVNTLLNRHPELKKLDYLNIDAEGFELEILSGIDFKLITPKVISIEQNDILTFNDVLDSEVCKFLTAKGYQPFAKNILLPDVSTVFYYNQNVGSIR
jgi:FkbM family methyltransferase